MGVLVPGWREPAPAAAGRTPAGADAGGLWDSARRQPTPARLPAQFGRKPGSVGGFAAGSVPARAGREEPVADCDGWLRGAGRGSQDGLSPRSTSALLGA